MHRFQIVKQLGEKSQGFISQADNQDTGERVIIKQHKKKFYTWQDCMQQREIKVLRVFNHPNIVKLKELIKENTTLYSVYEYTDQNLFEFYQNIRDQNQQFTETEIKSIMYQIFSGLHYTHKMQFFHRDLCLENIYINDDTQQVKISNFSSAREMSSRTQLTDYITTRWYRAPEQLLHSPTYNYKVDCWAAGCIMAELFLLGPLFGGSSESDQLWRIIKVMGTPTDWPEFYSLINNMTKKQGQTKNYQSQDFRKIIPNASVEALDLIKKLLVFNPQKRYSSAQALKHPFFTGQPLGRLNSNTPKSNKHATHSNQPSMFSKLPNINNNKNSDNLDRDNINNSEMDIMEVKSQSHKQLQESIQNIKEEDEISQNSNQSNKPVPLDVQQHQAALQRPGSRDCSREQRENNSQIKFEKEMGQISSSKIKSQEQIQDIQNEQQYDQENNDNQKISLEDIKQDQVKENTTLLKQKKPEIGGLGLGLGLGFGKSNSSNNNKNNNDGLQINVTDEVTQVQDIYKKKIVEEERPVTPQISVSPETKVRGVKVNADMHEIDSFQFKEQHLRHEMEKKKRLSQEKLQNE